MIILSRLFDGRYNYLTCELARKTKSLSSSEAHWEGGEEGMYLSRRDVLARRWTGTRCRHGALAQCALVLCAATSRHCSAEQVKRSVSHPSRRSRMDPAFTVYAHGSAPEQVSVIPRHCCVLHRGRSVPETNSNGCSGFRAESFRAFPFHQKWNVRCFKTILLIYFIETLSWKILHRSTL
jgi:hypothetical protein